MYLIQASALTDIFNIFVSFSSLLDGRLMRLQDMTSQIPISYLGVFTVRFGSVFIKKSNQTEFFLKKINRNRTETGSNRPVSVRFGFLEKKPVQTGLARFFGLTRFFPVWLGFGSIFSVWLGFFLVPGLKNRNRTEPVGFFKILIGLIGFFLGLVF